MKQERLLLLNINELYVQFKLKYPNIKIGFSKCCELRPKWIVTVGMHSVCVCQYHQNVKLLVHAIPNLTLNYKELMEKMVCNLESKECMLHLCEQCPGKDNLELFVTQH